MIINYNKMVHFVIVYNHFSVPSTLPFTSLLHVLHFLTHVFFVSSCRLELRVVRLAIRLVLLRFDFLIV